jgi:hypothetical protein
LDQIRGLAQSRAVYSFGFQIKRRPQEKNVANEQSRNRRQGGSRENLKPIFSHAEDIKRNRDLSQVDNSVGTCQTPSAVTDGGA